MVKWSFAKDLEAPASVSAARDFPLDLIGAGRARGSRAND
jgi:hypothetical protein